MKARNIAVIGAGHLGKIHAKLLKTIDGVNPFVVETDPNARDFVENELGIPTFETVSGIGQQLDGAIIVTPTQAHFEVASNLIEAGCHLFVEKPVCADAESSRLLCELAERNELLLQVGHVERFNPAFVAAQPYMQDVRLIECTRFTPYTFRATDVSVVQDLMIHDIDLVLASIQSEVVSVQATGNKLIGPHWDSATAWIEFANGAHACLRASRVSSSPNRSMQCTLGNGWLNVDFAAQSVQHLQPVADILEKLTPLNAEQKLKAKDEMFEKWLPVTDVEVVPQNAILEEQQEFVNCINDESYPTVSGRDGLAAVEVAEQVLDSLDRHQSEKSQRFAA